MGGIIEVIDRETHRRYISTRCKMQVIVASESVVPVELMTQLKAWLLKEQNYNKNTCPTLWKAEQMAKAGECPRSLSCTHDDEGTCSSTWM